MNKDRRQKLREALKKLHDLSEDIEQIMDEEQEAYDNMPESLQESERGEKSYTAITQMEDVLYSLEQASDDLEEVVEG